LKKGNAKSQRHQSDAGKKNGYCAALRLYGNIFFQETIKNTSNRDSRQLLWSLPAANLPEALSALQI